MIRGLAVFLFSSAFLVPGSGEMESRRAGFELDHFFVAAPSPEAGSAELGRAGFLLGPSNPHPGQGTTSRGIFFENVYLELIWLTSPEEAASPPIQRTRLSDRMLGSGGACPFGIGLRGKGETEVKLPFETWEYRPPYLPEGLFFLMASSSEKLEEPLVFFLPWISAQTPRNPGNPNGTRRVTKLEMVLENAALDSKTLSALSEAGVASFRTGAQYLMKVELDDGQSGKALDLRPGIPLLIEW